MKIATFNVNGISAGCRTCCEWLEREAARRRLPAGTQGAGRALSRRAQIRDGRLRRDLARPDASWNGVAILARGTSRSRSAAGCRAIRTTRRAATSRRRCNGDRRRLPVPAQRQSAARPEVRLQAGLVRAPDRARRRRCRQPAIRWCWPATTTWCRPTSSTSTTRARGARTRCCSRRPASATGACSPRAGPMRSARCIPTERIYTFWDYFRKHWQRNAGLRIDHLLLNATLAPRLERGRRRPLGARPARTRATTRRRG